MAITVRIDINSETRKRGQSQRSRSLSYTVEGTGADGLSGLDDVMSMMGEDHLNPQGARIHLPAHAETWTWPNEHYILRVSEYEIAEVAKAQNISVDADVDDSAVRVYRVRYTWTTPTGTLLMTPEPPEVKRWHITMGQGSQTVDVDLDGKRIGKAHYVTVDGLVTSTPDPDAVMTTQVPTGTISISVEMPRATIPKEPLWAGALNKVNEGRLFIRGQDDYFPCQTVMYCGSSIEPTDSGAWRIVHNFEAGVRLMPDLLPFKLAATGENWSPVAIDEDLGDYLLPISMFPSITKYEEANPDEPEEPTIVKPHRVWVHRILDTADFANTFGL